MKHLLLPSIAIAIATLVPASFGQGAAPPAPSVATPTTTSTIPYPNVAAALAALQAKDGDSTIVTHSEGWVIINEPGAAAQWSFAPKDHAAYPAVVRRVIRHLPNGDVAVDMSSLCEAGTDACAGLLKEFESLNERVRQARRASMPRPVPPQQ